MTSPLYSFNKPKTPLFHKILGYTTLIFFFSTIAILIILSFLIDGNEAFSFNSVSLIFVVFIIGIQILIFFLKIKSQNTSKKTFDTNVNEGAINIPKPLASLSAKQTDVLKRLHSYSYSAHKAFLILIPIFLLFDGFIIFAILRNGLSILILMPIIFTLAFQGTIIHYGRRHYSYYLDLISPIFHVKGECSLAQSGSPAYLIVNGTKFTIDYNQDLHIQNQINQITVGELLEVIYSPHSKHIWEINVKTP